MKTIKQFVLLILIFIISYIIGYLPFYFISVEPLLSKQDVELETTYRKMIRIFYDISKSDKEYNSLYNYYEKGYLYSPIRTISSPRDLGVGSTQKLSLNRNPLLTENEFDNISGFTLINSVLIDKYCKNIILSKLPLSNDAPMSFKRLGFSCIFNDVPMGCNLRKEYPAKYFKKSQDQK